MRINHPWHVAAALCLTANTALSYTSLKLIHQFQPPYWVENLAVRPNGNIIPITTLHTSEVLQQLNPTTSALELIHDFNAVGNSIQSITAVKSDVFVVNVLTCNLTALDCTDGSASSWLIEPCKNNDSLVTQLTTWPDEGLLNGMAALNDHIALIADSLLGGIWTLNIKTHKGRLLFTDPSMSPPTGVRGAAVNGIRIRSGRLYFTNSAKATLNYIDIDSNGMKVGQASVIASNLTGPDDFEINESKGLAYLANGAANQVLSIDLVSGKVRDMISAPGPTSLRWSDGEGSRLYVSTNGGLTQYAEHNITVGGAIYELV